MAHDVIYNTCVDQGVVLMCSKDGYFQKFTSTGKEFTGFKHKFLERVGQFYQKRGQKKWKKRVFWGQKRVFWGQKGTFFRFFRGQNQVNLEFLVEMACQKHSKTAIYHSHYIRILNKYIFCSQKSQNKSRLVETLWKRIYTNGYLRFGRYFFSTFSTSF